MVGYGEGETYLGSDALALAPLTQRIAYLEEGDWVVITRDKVQIFDRDNQPVEREIITSGASADADREGQLPPLHAEGDLRAADRRRADPAQLHPPGRGQVALPQIDFDLASVERVTIVACGTSYYAGMVAKYWFEQFARVPVDIDVASEFRYREPVLEPGGLALFISQSRARPPTRWRRCATPGRRADDRGRRQRPDQLDGARGGPAAADPCRAGDRRRLDQGLHLPARRAGGAGRQPGAASRAG